MKSWKKSLLLTIPIILSTLIGKGQTSEQDTLQKESSTYAFIDNEITNKNMCVGMNYGGPRERIYLEAGNKNINFATWSNFNLEQNFVEEIDYILSVNKTFNLDSAKSITISPGVANYTFPNTEMGDAQEVFVKTNISGLPIDIYLKLAKTFNTGTKPGTLGVLKASKSLELGKKAKITAQAEMAYNNNYFSTAKGISHSGLGVTLGYKISDKITISATGTYQIAVDKDFEETVFSEPYLATNFTYTF